MVRQIRNEFGTPVFVYDEASLIAAAEATLAFPHTYGLTVRYAMKASPNAAILRLFDEKGLHFDVSSGFEAHRAMKAGIAAEKISLSAQELASDVAELHDAGVKIVATSLNQIQAFGQQRRGATIALRFNPGVGSGGTNRTNVGGPSASFGIWHEWLEQAVGLCSEFDLTVDRVHTHIGSGSDPDVWSRVALLSLELVERLPTVTCLDLGGGYKVARMRDESSTDLQEIGARVQMAFEEFAERTGREIQLEIEPGTFLTANCGTLLTTVQDIVSTGPEGHEFIRTDTGMTEILRPSLYGAQHPIIAIAAQPSEETTEAQEYQVVGHCCESGDIMTPAPGDPESLAGRSIQKVRIGDLIAIEGVGAYCSAMCASNYNSFPIAPEVLMRSGGESVLIRRRQRLDEILSLEV